jgi:hypothetical protein
VSDETSSADPDADDHRSAAARRISDEDEPDDRDSRWRPRDPSDWDRHYTANVLVVAGFAFTVLNLLTSTVVTDPVLSVGVGIGLLAAASGLLLVPGARVARLKPMQRDVVTEDSDLGLALQAVLAFLIVVAVLLGLGLWAVSLGLSA